jgi:hypothetical protein
MSDITWVAEPAEIAIGTVENPVSILVGIAEQGDGYLEGVAMVIHSATQDVVTRLTPGLAMKLGDALSEIVAVDDLWPPFGERVTT